ncbi:MAG: BNR repeat-containing protein [Armatimonadota bacterium]
MVDKIDVAPVWSGHSVGFCLLTYGDDQFATFYDKDRQMTLAQRKLNERTWKLTKLPQKVGWDSHNYITMAVDNNGYLHLCGNMHVNPLVYFRSKKPLDISEMINVGHMVGTQEEHVTYPRFMNGPNTELIFTYRDGKSGSGNQIYNVYNEKTQSWSRLLDKPLIDGEGKRNAYIDGPVLGPDGWYHMCWVWRDTPDCSTNHDPSYTKSPDMLHWYTSAGKLLELPITYETAEIVDHVPVRDGLINSNVRIGFDSQKRPIITYHKYDKDGNTQIYDARLESGVWKTHRITDWKYRWWFEGGRSIQSEIGLSAVMPYGPGKIAQTFSHKKYGSKRLVIDEQTMQIVSNTKTESAIIRKPEGNFPGLMVKTGNDIGKCSEDGVRYMLCWETLGANYDKPREGEMPPPSMLRVYKIKKS